MALISICLPYPTSDFFHFSNCSSNPTRRPQLATPTNAAYNTRGSFLERKQDRRAIRLCVDEAVQSSKPAASKQQPDTGISPHKLDKLSNGEIFSFWPPSPW